MKVVFLIVENIWVTEVRWTWPHRTSAAHTAQLTITDRSTYTGRTQRAGAIYCIC